MDAKPNHLAPQYGAQFEDAAVAAAYRHRPPYPAALYDTLLQLLDARTSRVLELGAGTAEIARGLAPRLDHIDAVEPSAAMLAQARAAPGGRHPNITWHHCSAERFDYAHRYGLVIAAESLHWMQWDVVLPAIARDLTPHARLVIIDRPFATVPWWDEITPLIPVHSTNRDFKPYDLLTELEARALFTPAATLVTAPQPFRQHIDDYIESWHSRNGFSRDRMPQESAARFDAALRTMLARYATDDHLTYDTQCRVSYGVPATAPAQR